VAEGRKRVTRQRRRVERIQREGRDARRVTALLETFARTQTRREQLLQGFNGLRNMLARSAFDSRGGARPFGRLGSGKSNSSQLQIVATRQKGAMWSPTLGSHPRLPTSRKICPTTLLDRSPPLPSW
jgi:hypothetical protein